MKTVLIILVAAMLAVSQASGATRPTSQPYNEVEYLRGEVARLQWELDQLRTALTDAGVITTKVVDHSPIMTDYEKETGAKMTGPSMFGKPKAIVPATQP